MTDAKRSGSLSTLARSTIGAKIVMAVTGVILVGFLVVHMLGNLQVYLGSDTMNHYGQTLKGTPALLWGARATLLASLVLHVLAALRLKKVNDAARPQAYATPRRYRATTTPARFMLLSGLVVLAFIVYHLLHFTFGAVQPATYATALGSSENPDVYGMVIYGFRNPLVAGSYIVAMALLCMHLAHGMSSWFQSLGLNHPKYNALIRNTGPIFAGIVFAGNTMIVLAVLFRLIGQDLPDLGA